MPRNEGEVLFYGLEGIDKKLDNIISTLNLDKQNFEIKLIMMEAITNAFFHGNNSKEDKLKLVCLHYELKDNLLLIEVTHCGESFKNISIPKEINDEDLLKESGRGLYLIGCYTDEVKFKGNSIIMKKYVNKGAVV